MSVRREIMAMVLVIGVIGLGGCGGRTPMNGDGDGGATADGPYLVDDAGNVIRDDAGNPIPVPQDGGGGHDDAPVVVVDAATPQQDSGATPGVIACGQTTCEVATQQCCVTQSGASCIALDAACVGLDVTCDGPEDCSSGTPICCARLGGGGDRGVTCTDECRGTQLCRLDTDCPDGDRCCGSGTLGNVTATWCVPADQCENTEPTPGVPCGDTTCSSPEVCCTTYSGSTCGDANDCQGLALACDGPEDCAGGTPVCCATLSTGGGGSECVADGDCAEGMGTGVVCHADGDCPDNGTCTAIPMVDLRLCR